MKVTLLFPGITADGFAADGIRPKTGWISHSLCYISAALKKAGHAVSLIDLRQLKGWEELPRTVKVQSPDVVGITMMSLDFGAAVTAAKAVKATDRRIKIVVGGVHPSLEPSELLGNEDVDYIFKGEAEITFPRVLDGIASGSLKQKIIQGEIPDLDEIPFVDRGFFRILEAPVVPFLKMPFITSLAGRGCTYNCNFCQPAERKIYGARVRRVSPGRFMEELALTKERIGLNSLMIHDECVVEDAKWMEGFLKLYGKQPFKKPFICQARADIIAKRPALFRDMKRCGLAMLFIGFESGSQRVLNFLRKGTTVEQNYAAASICNRLGIRIFANFMLGIPTETKEEALETVRMIKRIRPYVASPAFYTPFPGSDLFEYCKENNLSLIEKHSEYVRNPTGPKIRGVDYKFLAACVADASKVALSVRLRRKIDRLRLGRFNKELIASHNVGN